MSKENEKKRRRIKNQKKKLLKFDSFTNYHQNTNSLREQTHQIMRKISNFVIILLSEFIFHFHAPFTTYVILLFK